MVVIQMRIIIHLELLIIINQLVKSRKHNHCVGFTSSDVKNQDNKKNNFMFTQVIKKHNYILFTKLLGLKIYKKKNDYRNYNLIT